MQPLLTQLLNSDGVAVEDYRDLGEQVVLEVEAIQDWAICPRCGQTSHRVHQSHFHLACIRLVVENLNIHHPVALYETFPPEEANRLLKQLEFHYTPKHASWLNQVEMGFSVLSRQCLNRRIATKEALIDEINTWQQQRNAQKATVNWRFKTTDARVKLQRLYPPIEPCKVDLADH